MKKEELNIILSIILTVFFQYSSYAQNEGNFWYFGANAGLDFNSGAPVAVIDGQLNTSEGCASISDNNGDLLFYTDGMTVYDRNHAVMPNGMGLLGNISSTQSAIIVQKPSSNNIYYIFTVDGGTGASGGFHYSEVDMSLQAGLGDVTANKNIMIFPQALEKVSAIKHQNNQDFWIIAPDATTQTINSYLFTSTGLNMVPVVNAVLNNIDFVGYLRGSPNGDKIVNVNAWTNNYELFDFDNTTGVLTSQLTAIMVGEDPYGAEFSPNNELLYISCWPTGNVYQYNLMAGSNTDILNSSTVVGQAPGIGGALQLGSDMKIYQAVGSASSLAVINDPDLVGFACNYDVNGVSLGGFTSYYGLPTFYSSIFFSNTIDINGFCYGDSSYFNSSNTSVDSVFWDFGDPSSGIHNHSTKLSVSHLYSDTGSFNITLYSYLDGLIDTTFSNVYVYPLPEISLGNDTLICEGDVVLFDVTAPQSTYLWHDNTTSSTFQTDLEGDYFVVVTDSNQCSNIDSVTVLVNPKAEVTITGDIEVCQGTDVFLFFNIIGISPFNLVFTNSLDTFYAQQKSSFNYQVNSSGIYSVVNIEDSLGCLGTSIGSATVVINPKPTADFSHTPLDATLNDPMIEFDNLSTNYSIVNWYFGDGSTDTLINPTYIYLEANTFNVKLVATNQFNCTDSITYPVVIKPPTFDLFIPNSFTPNGDARNELWNIQAKFILSFNLKIFNRFGEEIFSSDDINKSWDGTFNAKESQQGTYTYLITVEDFSNTFHSFPGSFNLVR